MQLQKATRKKTKLRLNLSAPSGAGKTYSALLMAKGLVGDWEKIAVIDTENGSASLYEHLGPFNTIDLQPPFSPERYVEAIKACVAGGMECIIIDSSSHEWSGPGGCLEINDGLAASKFKGNTWAAWSETNPRHDNFVNSVLHCNAHVITCTRSKTETIQDGGKIKKLGMKDVQREGWEYELTVSLSLDRDTHKAIASKDRTELFEGLDPFIITEETGKKIKDWCEKGVDVEAEARAKAEALAAQVTDAIKAIDKCKSQEKVTEFMKSLAPELATIPEVRAAGSAKFKSFPVTEKTRDAILAIVADTEKFGDEYRNQISVFLSGNPSESEAQQELKDLQFKQAQ